MLENAFTYSYAMVHTYFYQFRASLKFVECGGQIDPPGPVNQLKNTYSSNSELYELLDVPTAAMTVCNFFLESFSGTTGIISKLVCFPICEKYKIQSLSEQWDLSITTLNKLSKHLLENRTTL